VRIVTTAAPRRRIGNDITGPRIPHHGNSGHFRTRFPLPRRDACVKTPHRGDLVHLIGCNAPPRRYGTSSGGVSKESNVRKIALLLIVLMSFQSVGVAGTRATIEKQVARTKARVEKIGVGEKHRINVLLRDDSWVKGYVAAIDEDSFAVMEKKAGTIRTIVYSDVVSVSGPDSKKRIAIVSVAGIAMIGAAVAAVYAASFRPFSCDPPPVPLGPGGSCTVR